MELRRGDFFLVQVPLMGGLINFFQRIWAYDGQATYSHAGIILDSAGTTLEAVTTVKEQNLFTAYAGRRVLVARFDTLTTKEIERGLAGIAHQRGRLYPVWRLLFHAVPPLARFIATGPAVCSELVAQFYCAAGVMTWWAGCTPDYLADKVRDHRLWEIVFEGQLPTANEQGAST